MKSYQRLYIIGLFLVFLAAILLTVFISRRQQTLEQQASIQAPVLERQELITSQAATGDGANGWSNNKSRIVRTSTGDIYAAYVAPGTSSTEKQFRLMHRTSSGWVQVLSGNGGREPINVLRGPDDQIDLITWPNGQPQLLRLNTTNGNMKVTSSAIPGSLVQSNSQYAGAAITQQGNIYICRCENISTWQWLYLTSSDNQWHSYPMQMSDDYAYAFVTATDNGELSVSATRDAPADVGFGYLFNEVKFWQTSNFASQPFTGLSVKQEDPSGSSAFIAYQTDAYEDTQGRMHILYVDVNNHPQGRHAIIQDGKVVKDVSINIPNAGYTRIIQDTAGRFYIISGTKNSLHVLPGAANDSDGTEFDPMVTLPLQYKMCTIGDTCQSPHLAVPRGGTPLADYVDGVYNSGSGEKWVYFRLRLRGSTTDTTQTSGQAVSLTPSYAALLLYSIGSCPIFPLPQAVMLFPFSPFATQSSRKTKQLFRSPCSCAACGGIRE